MLDIQAARRRGCLSARWAPRTPKPPAKAPTRNIGASFPPAGAPLAPGSVRATRVVGDSAMWPKAAFPSLEDGQPALHAPMRYALAAVVSGTSSSAKSLPFHDDGARLDGAGAVLRFAAAVPPSGRRCHRAAMLLFGSCMSGKLTPKKKNASIWPGAGWSDSEIAARRHVAAHRGQSFGPRLRQTACTTAFAPRSS